MACTWAQLDHNDGPGFREYPHCWRRKLVPEDPLAEIPDSTMPSSAWEWEWEDEDEDEDEEVDLMRSGWSCRGGSRGICCKYRTVADLVVMMMILVRG